MAALVAALALPVALVVQHGWALLPAQLAVAPVPLERLPLLSIMEGTPARAAVAVAEIVAEQVARVALVYAVVVVVVVVPVRQVLTAVREALGALDMR